MNGKKLARYITEQVVKEAEDEERKLKEELEEVTSISKYIERG